MVTPVPLPVGPAVLEKLPFVTLNENEAPEEGKIELREAGVELAEAREDEDTEPALGALVTLYPPDGPYGRD